MVPPSNLDLGRLDHEARKRESDLLLPSAESVLMSLQRRITPEVRTAIVSRYEAGEPAMALSLEYGISRDSVRRLLRRAVVTIWSQFVVIPHASKQILELYEGGFTIRQVAARAGCAFGTACSVLHESGAQMRESPIGRRVVSEG